MSLYKQRNGYTGNFDIPPTCDGCGAIISTHRSRWHTLWNKPVLICVRCRSLAHPGVLRKQLAHIKSLLKLEEEYVKSASGTGSHELTKPGQDSLSVSAPPETAVML